MFRCAPGSRGNSLRMGSNSPIYTIDPALRSCRVADARSPEDWDIVFRAAAENQITRLNAPGIDDSAMARLRELPGLRSFKACWANNISDAGAAALKDCPFLEDVDLLGTPTGDGVIRALAGNPNLRRLQTGKFVTDAGLRLLHEFPIFKTWRGGEPRYGLLSADAEPNFLLIDGPFTDAGLASLVRLDGLFALSLFWHSHAFTSAGLKSLRQLPQLGFFGCQKDRCDDAAMRQIATFPRLRMLMAQGTAASDEGFEALSHSPTIEYLWGRECPNLTGRGFISLSTMPSLCGLAVSCRNVDDAALARLPDFASLRELVPVDVTDAGFRHIGKCENLEALWCMYCRDTGDTATEHIAGLRLKTYYAGQSNITDRSLEILGRMSSLERIELRQCAGLTDSGIAQLANLFKLRELTLEALPGVTEGATRAFPANVRVQFSR